MIRSFAIETMAKTCDKDFCSRDVHNFVKGDLIQESTIIDTSVTRICKERRMRKERGGTKEERDQKKKEEKEGKTKENKGKEGRTVC
jgi:hypothetical protein